MVGRITRVGRFLDVLILISLLFVVGFLVFSSGRANIQTDSIDYYAILQRLTDNGDSPIVRNLHFLEQRSPGYSIASTVPYYFASVVIAPFVETEEIAGAPREQGFVPAGPKESESMQLPRERLLVRDIFFKNFYIESEGSWFDWKVIFGLLFTSYLFLLVGIFFVVRTLSLQAKGVIGASLIMLVLFTSDIFLHNILDTPAYATLAAFGASSIFCYFFVKGFLEKNPRGEFLSGVSLGLLTLIRFEAVVLLLASLLFLGLDKNRRFLTNLVKGFSLAVPVLLVYNLVQFGSPFHLGMLKGDINKIALDFGYIFANLFNPSSGIVFWSPLISIGIAGLFFSTEKYSRALGVCSVALIGLYLFRVPIMYSCSGDGSTVVGGLVLRCAENTAEALTLVRYDMNRYVTLLAPFSVLGLRNLILLVGRRLRPILTPSP